MAVPAKQQAAAQPPPQAPKRSALSQVTTGKQSAPFRLALYGVAGCGKSTFASLAPRPIFLRTEDGVGHLDVPKLPKPGTWPEVLEQIRELEEVPHEYRTLVIDTLDELEKMIHEHICKRDGKANVEEYGYGKGWVAAAGEWRLLLAALERLRRAKPMAVILIAHDAIKAWKNPDGESYDRYVMNIHQSARDAIMGWCDAVLFAQYESFVRRDERTRRAIGYSTGERVIRTERNATYDAKNRYGLPDTLPLDWNAFAKAYKESQQPTKKEEVTP